MSEESTTTSKGTARSKSSSTAVERSSTSSSDEGRSQLESDHGRTTIARSVVSTIAGVAVREVQGVHKLGGGASRVAGAVRNRIPGSNTNHSQGISVEVGEKQAAVDVELVAEYGVPLADLAAGIRNNVITTLEQMTGLEITEVNIDIIDIDVPEDDESDENRRQLQ